MRYLFDNLDWSSWVYGLVSGAIGGGAGSVVASVAASALAPDRLALGGSKFFELMGIVFLTHGAISMAMYLQQNPLPKKITVTDEASSKSVTVGDGKTKTTETAVKSTTTVTGGENEREP